MSKSERNREVVIARVIDNEAARDVALRFGVSLGRVNDIVHRWEVENLNRPYRTQWCTIRRYQWQQMCERWGKMQSAISGACNLMRRCVEWPRHQMEDFAAITKSMELWLSCFDHDTFIGGSDDGKRGNEFRGWARYRQPKEKT